MGRSGVVRWRERVGNGTTTKRKDLKTVLDRGLVACVYVRCTCVYLLVSGALVLVSPWLSVVYNGAQNTRIH